MWNSTRRIAPPAQVDCGQPAPPVLGCGSIIHGIAFGFDSAEIRAESAGVLEELFRGLQADRSATILIEGHTSSEGTEEYNQRLSERRAQALVADLVQRGLGRDRLSVAGIGERRSLNRRVEVKCV
jgi:outer membrane protein OmpA-like peptidoglycan-associated protein